MSWKDLTKRWYWRLVIVLLAPVWIPAIIVGCILYFACFLVWGIFGPPIWYVITGDWIEPEPNNWTRKAP